VTLFGEPDPPGATPLTPDDVEGLLPTWVATRADLNQVEQANIESAVRWAFVARKPVGRVEGLLTPQFSDRVHTRMFGDVWAWAGSRRRQLTNIGVDPIHIAAEMKLTFDDAIYWHVNGVFEPVELAVRIHHRLVSVHPYPNGNGRQARLIADLYLHITGQRRLTWGGGAPLGSSTVDRSRYIDALRAADAGDIEPLVTFART
jgi:Fic-DOC domain mobile mystery protein B